MRLGLWLEDAAGDVPKAGILKKKIPECLLIRYYLRQSILGPLGARKPLKTSLEGYFK